MTDDPTACFRLDGRVAIVTGASSGLGRRFVHVLLGAGAQVVACARRQELLDTLEPGDSLICVRADVTLDTDRERVLAVALERFGRLDVLVNNAGTSTPAPALDEGAEAFRSVLEVNLTAPFLLTQLAARHMIDHGGGSVVNISSILGVVGSGQIPLASYAASKGAITNLTRELAAQWARKGIRVNALAPGWFASEMTDSMLNNDKGRRFIETRTPMGRSGRSDELDGPLLFLASDASSFVTGQILCIDGGWTII